MQITSRFTIAVHIITCIDYFGNDRKLTSEFLSDSIGVNPVIIRTVISKLKAAKIVYASQGSSGVRLASPLSEITFYDVYKAVDCVDSEEGLFHFHENPSTECPVGRNIHGLLDERLHDIQNAMEAEMKKYTLDSLHEGMQELLEKEA